MSTVGEKPTMASNRAASAVLEGADPAMVERTFRATGRELTRLT